MIKTKYAKNFCNIKKKKKKNRNQLMRKFSRGTNIHAV